MTPNEPTNDAPRMSDAERIALQQVLQAGEAYGFGRCVQALAFAWARKLKDTEGFDDAAALAGGVVHEAWDMKPKVLTKKRAAVLMEFGDGILADIRCEQP